MWVDRIGRDRIGRPRLQRLLFVFLTLAMISSRFFRSSRKESLTKSMANWLATILRSRSSHKALSAARGCDHRLVGESDAQVGYKAPSVRIFD